MRHPRPEHEFTGTCCGHPEAWHRPRYRKGHSGPSGKKKPYVTDYPFFDTESWNDSKGRARLVYMSCYSRGEHLRYENPKGIQTLDALIWMAESLPCDSRSPLAWFYGGYDMSLILRDLPAWLHWLLLHPEKRRVSVQIGSKTRRRIAPIKWEGFKLDWLGGMLSIEKGDRRVVLYDICKYYQCSFLKALTEWKIGTEKERQLIAREKARRNKFSRARFEQIKKYCDLETRLGSELWKKLREAHSTVGLKVNKWLGPGRTAKAMLRGMYARCYGDDKKTGEVRWQREIRHARLRVPKEAWHAFACAFFGGRFENSYYGKIEGPLWSADIASAYPWAITKLPCLLHGEWKHLTKWQGRDFDLCCFRYKLRAFVEPREKMHWAPLPFREPDGSICYPDNAVGWAWWPEIEQAELWASVRFLEGWFFKSKCNCPVYTRHSRTDRPESVDDYYQYRLRLGKDGPGMVVKFALNSLYGVKAQVLGITEYRSLSPFQSFIEAGMITSLTRARLLRAIHTLGSENVVMVNTDSVTSRVKPMWSAQKELGTWEVIEHPHGLTCVKQGMYFDRLFSKLRARGIGRSVLERNATSIERALTGWIQGGSDVVKLRQTRDVFHGQRECTDMLQGVTDFGKLAYNASRGTHSKDEALFKKRPYYGTWEKAKQQITFTPLPKRERVLEDGRLLVRDVGGAESAPYSKALGFDEIIRGEEAELDRAELDFPDGGHED